MNATRAFTTAVALLGAGLITATGALAAHHRPRPNIIERTPQGFVLTVRIDYTGKAGTMSVTCPDEHYLGTSRRFDIHKGHFTAIRRAGHSQLFRYDGYLDQPHHVRGSGTVHKGACGLRAASAFSEGAIGTARMEYCPPSSVNTPLTPGVAYTFGGLVPNAAQGTAVRLEYTDPASALGEPEVVHLSTDSRGAFSDSHALPASAGELYGASATPRHPDDPLAPGIPCGMEVQG